ncbi:methionine-R-sulfoxide reductase B3 isoform X2 [Suricata suricatta]|uniref:methionine-R-sulfoxide reductase B3 isoform X2 n=1 Tax=Suricata suricatta TaxID=37032 RepID=UPI00115552C8|nr:methionine-R-sulfoxide reductase B3 isoform X2 [Suricata suricatta]XP_029810736.1 methionine-R-sulfoxide reductase B3 isoform X2 [Suricata suricatta]
MSAFNLLHLVTKSQPVALRACGLPSGSCRDKKNCKVVFSQQELRKRLTPLQYHVTQEKGTESAFEGEYTHHKDPGIYKCVVCGTPLFKDFPDIQKQRYQQTWLFQSQHYRHLDWIMLCCRRCLTHRRICRSTPDLCSLDASSTRPLPQLAHLIPTSWQRKISPDSITHPLGGKLTSIGEQLILKPTEQ